MKISVIIPTLNEERLLPSLLERLEALNDQSLLLEVLLVDGGSTDATLKLVHGPKLRVLHSPKVGRAFQMNYAAKRAKGDLLYFIHADTQPPLTCLTDLSKAFNLGKEIGCFRFRFDKDGFVFRVNSYFTRFNFLWCRGGDQTLFITKTFFEDLNGYREDFLIMEEYDLIKRAQKRSPFTLFQRK